MWYCAGVGYHLPRTGSLSPIQSGGQCYGICSYVEWPDYNSIIRLVISNLAILGMILRKAWDFSLD